MNNIFLRVVFVIVASFAAALLPISSQGAAGEVVSNPISTPVHRKVYG